MDVYRVIMRVSPAVVLTEPKTIVHSENIQIRFENVIDPELRAPTGLKISAKWQADSIDQAISRVRGHADRTLSLFGFLTNTSLPEIHPVKCYTITPEKKEGIFVQYHYDLPIRPVSSRLVDDEELRASIESINSLSESHNNRVLRAMHWYRLAIRSRDALDIFISLWISLKSIDPVLRDHFHLETEFRTCPECNRKIHPMLNGVKKVLSAVSGSEKTWTKIGRIRVGLVHGFRDFNKMLSSIRQLIPTLK
jgi:hypothetical protein